MDYLAIGYYITSLLSVPSSDTSNVQLKILKIDDQGLKLLLLELLKYRTFSVGAARLEIEIAFSTNIIENTKLIASFLEQSSALIHFRGTGLVVTEDTAQALTTMLQVNKTLTHLDLSNNWKLQNASCVFQGLQNNTTLVYLNLSNIQLEVKKDTPLAKALTTMLQKNKHLKHLDLSYNPLYNEGVYCLCEGLQLNITLVYLNLSSTGITDKGAEWIALAYNSKSFFATKS